MGFRWYNWIGLAMLIVGAALSEPVFLVADYQFSILWLLAALYFLIAAGLVLWEGPETDED